MLALWSTTGAMTTYMTAVNMAFGRKEGRGFVKTRLVALKMVAVIVVRSSSWPVEQHDAAHAILGKPAAVELNKPSA